MRLPERLPPLDGLRGRVFAVLFVALTAIAVLVTTGATVFSAIDEFRNIPVDGAYGFNTVTMGSSGTTLRPGPAARRAGLKRDDVLVAIDGEPLPSTASENEVGARMARAGREVTLTVRTGDSAPRPVQLRRAPGSIWTAPSPDGGMPVWLAVLLDYLTVCLSWVLLSTATTLFVRRRHDPGAMAFASAFSLSAFGSQTFWFGPLGIPNEVATLALALYICGASLLVVAIAGFPDGRFRGRAARVAPWLGLPSVVLAAAWLLSDPGSVRPPAWVRSGLDYLGPLGATGVLIGVVAQVLRYRRKDLSSVERQQYRWAIFSLSVTGLALALLVLLFQVGAAASQEPVVRFALAVANLVSQLAPPLGILVSLVRYRLYDAEAAISRSAVYGALTLGLLAIFAGSEKVIEVAGERWFGEEAGALAAGLAAAIAAVAIAPLHHRVSHWAEHRFQKALLHLRHGLPLLVGDLRETAPPQVIADAALTRIEDGVRATRSAVVAGGVVVGARGVDPGEVDVGDVDAGAWQDPRFPIRLPLAADGLGAVGTLLLGPRPDGSLYGKDEREALAEIADPLARALAIAQAREAAAAERRAEAQALSTRVARLEMMVTRLTGNAPGLAAG